MSLPKREGGRERGGANDDDGGGDENDEDKDDSHHVFPIRSSTLEWSTSSSGPLVKIHLYSADRTVLPPCGVRQLSHKICTSCQSLQLS